jgi:gas vesicle protein
MSDGTCNYFGGLLVGGLIGAAIGILYAPKSGKETREEIGRKAEELMAKAKEEYELALERSKKAYEVAVKCLQQVESSAKEKFSEMEGKAGEIAKRGKETLQDTNGSFFKKAMDAGVEAFKEEKEKAI